MTISHSEKTRSQCWFTYKTLIESCETTGDLYTYYTIVATIKSITFSFISSMAQNRTKHLSN